MAAQLLMALLLCYLNFIDKNNAMDKEIQLIQFQLREVYDGNPWYGRPLMSILHQATTLEAWNKQVSSGHTNLVLLRHMINWRLFTISRLEEEANKNTNYFDDNNWRIILNATKENWLDAMNDLAVSQKRLLHLLIMASDGILDNEVPGRSYDYRYLLYGIIQHDIYHIGQIMISIKED